MVLQQEKKSIISKNPFAVEPLPKSHYYPSKQKHLSKDQKKTSLNPDRSHKTPDERCREDDLFLKGSNIFTTKDAAIKEKEEESFAFEESWDSTERPQESSISVIEEKTEDLVKSFIAARQNKKSMFTEDSVSELKQDSDMDRTGSTLAKYVERFRNAKPMSRDERRQKKKADQEEFWWLSSSQSPTSSSTPIDHDTKRHRTKRFTLEIPSTSFRTADKDESKYSNIKPLKAEYLAQLDQDIVTRKLQERADRLLEQSSSSLNSTGPIVSTDGLGSVSSSSLGYSIEEVSFRPKYISQNIEKEKWRSKPSRNLHDIDGKSMPDFQPGKPLHPEDDILYQWRLRRKMEMARERVCVSKISKQEPSVVKPLSKNIKVYSKLDEFREKLSSAELGAPVHHLTSAKVHFTPAPEVQPQKQEEPIRSVKMPKESQVCEETLFTSDISQIASPILARQGNKSCVDPHHHLMCDLLPCPHQEDYSNETKKTDGKKYRQFLKAEKPDVEKIVQQTDETDRQFSTNLNKKLESDFTESEETTDNHIHKRMCDKETRLSNSEDVKNTHVDISEHSREKNNSPVVTTEDQNMECVSQVDEPRKQTFIPHSKETNRDLDSSVTDYEMDRSVQSPEHRVKSQQRVIPSQINQAIGQVVQDHLFDVTSTSVISSVDSMRSFLHSSPSLQKRTTDSSVEFSTISESPPQTDLKATLTSKQVEDEYYESDGEFPDDSLLKMLRQQRTQHEHQLRYLDSLLEEIAVGDKR